MNYSVIRTCDIANGPGVRVTLFVSGCRIHCPNCFNKEAQSFSYGKEFTCEDEDFILNSLNSSWITGLTILGGEPFEPENQSSLISLIRDVREEYPEKTIWMYSGYVYDKDLIKGGKKYVDGLTDRIFENIDVLVDGPFVESLKNISLKFRGSENQRIIRFIDGKPEIVKNPEIEL